MQRQGSGSENRRSRRHWPWSALSHADASDRWRPRAPHAGASLHSPSSPPPHSRSCSIPTSLPAAGLQNGNGYCFASPTDSSQHGPLGQLGWRLTWLVAMACCLAAEVTPTFLSQPQARGGSVFQELSVLKARGAAMNFSAGGWSKPVCFVGAESWALS